MGTGNRDEDGYLSAHRRPAQKRGFRGRKGAGRAEKHSGVAAVCGFVGGADGRGGAGRDVRLRGAVHGVVPSDGGGGEEEVRGEEERKRFVEGLDEENREEWERCRAICEGVHRRNSHKLSGPKNLNVM